MKKTLQITILGTLLCLLNSCKIKENMDYMKNIEDTAIQASVENSTLTIQPGDQLIIVVSAKDNDVVKPFNKNYSSSEISQFSLSSSNLPMQGQTTNVGPTYITDSKGEIDFPVLGILSTKGKTLEQFRDELRERLTQYIKNPSVNVKTTNFKVTVLGEVNKTGTYVIPDGQSMNILSVLGMAGDLTIYGQRTNVLVIRNIDGVTTKQYVDLTNAEFINSPYYYVKQNDVVYVSPNTTKKNSSVYGPQAGVFISIASIVVTILALIIK